LIIDHCLICHTEISSQLSWTTIFSKDNQAQICLDCQANFLKIDGETCRTCDRPLNNLNPKFKVQDQCLDCVRWEKESEWAGVLEKNHSLFTYNDFAQEVIARFKFRGDYVLAHAFAPLIKNKLQSLTFDAIVPIPLSEERLYDRGFNQSEALIGTCQLEPAHLLSRTHTEKQSKKSRSERIHLSQVFQVQGEATAKHILLIDDIYTTGSTLRHAAKQLKEAGAKTITSLTLARG
jgi:competence protein ComFC